MFPQIYGAVSQGEAAASDWWSDWFTISGKTCVAAYQAKGAPTQSDSYTNIADSGTYDLALGVAPTWASGTGWTFNGSTQWLESGITPSNAGDWSMFIRYSGYTKAANRCIAGSKSTTTTGFYLGVLSSGTAANYRHANSSSKTIADNAAGVTGFAAQAVYFDAVDKGTTNIGTPNFTRTIAIGAQKTGTTSVATFFPGSIQAVAIYSGTLSGADVTSLTSSMQGL